jgi:hypothetical protein
LTPVVLPHMLPATMKINLRLLLVSLVIPAGSLAQSPVPAYSHANFPIDQTINGLHPIIISGCACAMQDSQPGLAKMVVSPTSVPQAKVNQLITIRYDASRICNSMTIANMNGLNSPDPRAPDNPTLDLGTADWQVGDTQSLPREWGDITLPGYTQSGTYTLTIKMHLRCSAPPNQNGCPKTGYNSCVATAAVPITVK